MLKDYHVSPVEQKHYHVVLKHTEKKDLMQNTLSEKWVLTHIEPLP